MATLNSWLPAPAGLELPQDEVHVWRAGLDLSAERLEQLHQLLSADEQQRVARFYFEKDRRHYAAARGFLRTILARYLRLEPAHLRFSYNTFGKPEVAAGLSDNSVRLNLAHSHGLALFAVTRTREIGVDLEQVSAERATMDIAQRFFAPAEVAVLHSLPEQARCRAFFSCWTRKEAFIKARGLGLSLPLNQINADAKRLVAEGRDPQAEIDAGHIDNNDVPHHQNDGDNEVTGVTVSDGHVGNGWVQGKFAPSPAARTFFTQQHGENVTYQIVPARRCSKAWSSRRTPRTRSRHG